MQSLFLLYETCDPYAVFVFISIASPFIFLLEPTSSYTVAGSVCELGLCDDSLDLLEMKQRTEAANTPIEKDTTKVTETDTPTAVPMDEPTAAVHASAASIDGMKENKGYELLRTCIWVMLYLEYQR